MEVGELSIEKTNEFLSCGNLFWYYQYFILIGRNATQEELDFYYYLFTEYSDTIDGYDIVNNGSKRYIVITTYKDPSEIHLNLGGYNLDVRIEKVEL